MKLEKALEGLKPPPEVTRCIRCGQVLKDPKSIERKMGPICVEKAAAEDLEIDKDTTKALDSLEGSEDGEE